MNQERARMIAKIHLAKKQLALAEESYRAILERITGLDSAGKMRVDQLDAVLREFARLGWRPKPAAKRSAQPQIRMIHAVWADICRLQGRGDEAALRAFVRRQTKTEEHPDGVDSAEFLNAAMANRVLEGLKAWRARLQRDAAA
ncbi:MAG: regulatory protein GemA [Roseomonas sp.]|nr:regulatory protein GemA [Roseomonas sp.]